MKTRKEVNRMKDEKSMTGKIVKREYRGVTNAMFYENDNFHSVEIFNTKFTVMREEEPVYGINWAGIGTVSIEDARAYANLILEAANEAERMNK